VYNITSVVHIIIDRTGGVNSVHMIEFKYRFRILNRSMHMFCSVRSNSHRKLGIVTYVRVQNNEFCKFI